MCLRDTVPFGRTVRGCPVSSEDHVDGRTTRSTPGYRSGPPPRDSCRREMGRGQTVLPPDKDRRKVYQKTRTTEGFR